MIPELIGLVVMLFPAFLLSLRIVADRWPSA